MDVYLVKSYVPHGTGASIERFDDFLGGVAGAQRAAAEVGDALHTRPQQRADQYVWDANNDVVLVVLYKIDAAAIPAGFPFGMVVKLQQLAWMRRGEIVTVEGSKATWMD